MQAMEAEQLKDAINSAFSGLPVPAATTLIGPVGRHERAVATKFRRAIAGRTWQSLTQDFLGEWSSSFSYLSTEAYRYYLPALLIAGLVDYDGDMEIGHDVIHMLCPNFLALYYEGADKDAEILQSELKDQEYRLVCSFLGLLFEKASCWNYCAARALYWGWNRIETEELNAVKRYYHELRRFSRTEPENPDVAALCREIDAAFADTPYPADDSLCDDLRDPEPAEIALELRGVKWQYAHPTLLAQCYLALSFLQPEAFRYFLPAFLIADLCGFESNADPVFTLTIGLYDERIDRINRSAIREIVDAEGNHVKWVSVSFQETLDELEKTQGPITDSSMYEYTVNKLALFNRQERIAIIHYLEFQARDESHSPRIRQALGNYWLPSVL